MEIDPLGEVMTWISVAGLIGLFAAALAERFVPVIPSHGLLLSVGISASGGAWSLPTAIVVTSIGSFCGCAACFFAVKAFGDGRSRRLLTPLARAFGISAGKIDARIRSFRHSQIILAVSMQLIPTVRLLAPFFAAVLSGSTKLHLTGTAAGIVVWNSFFICIGFYASHKIETTNMTMLATAVFGGVLVIQFAVLWSGRRIQAIRDANNASWQAP